MPSWSGCTSTSTTPDWRRRTGPCRAGARLVATNDDATYPGEHGLTPGAGSLLAAVVTASGVDPIVAGKPYAPMVELVRALAGPDGVAVGDRADTDGRFARALGYRFGLVLTGVTTAADLPVDPAPDATEDDLAALRGALDGPCRLARAPGEPWRPDGDSTTSWCGGGSPRRAPGPRPTSSPAGSWSAARSPRRPRGWCSRAIPSSCRASLRGS